MTDTKSYRVSYSVDIETDAVGEDLIELAATALTERVLERLREDEYLTEDDVVVVNLHD